MKCYYLVQVTFSDIYWQKRVTMMRSNMRTI